MFYSTNDGKSYNGPLKSLSGAVGKNQKSGTAKKIVWDVLAEVIELTGYVKFKVKYKSSKYGVFTDSRDGKEYKTVKIGNQEWMAENLAYRPTSGNYWAYDNANKNIAKFGYLYDWETANKVCPAGWHLPSDKEWHVLRDYLGGEKSGTKMKSTSGWDDGGNGTNSSGFKGLPAGSFSQYQSNDSEFRDVNNYAKWWIDFEKNNDSELMFTSLMHFMEDLFFGYPSSPHNIDTWGLSIRCLKD